MLAQALGQVLYSNGHRHLLPSPDEMLIAGIIHDIGKLNVPDAILLKSQSLTDREWETMCFHPIWGARYIKNIPSLTHFSTYVLQHHENPNGKGYPHRLALDEICHAARIIIIADQFSAMTTDRPYRRAIEPNYAITYLEKNIELFFGSKNKKNIVECLLSQAIMNPINLDSHSHPIISCIFRVKGKSKVEV